MKSNNHDVCNCTYKLCVQIVLKCNYCIKMVIVSVFIVFCALIHSYLYLFFLFVFMIFLTYNFNFHYHILTNIPTKPRDSFHDDVIKCKHFPRYWPFVRWIHRSPVNSPHKGQWRGALMFSLICVWINGWVNIREAGGLRRYRAHYDVTVIKETDSETSWHPGW